MVHIEKYSNYVLQWIFLPKKEYIIVRTWTHIPIQGSFCEQRNEQCTQYGDTETTVLANTI